MSEETTSNTNQEIKENISLSNLLTFEEYDQSLNSDNRIINEPQSVIVKVEYPPESKETQTSKFVNIAGIVINLILAIITYLLYQQTVLQSQQSAQAVKSAIEAVSEAKNANSISEKNYELAKITFEGNNESTNRTLSLAEKSLNSQLLSIKKAQENFEIENKPYLEINSISKFEANEPFDGTFDIVNHGNGTVKATKTLLMLSFPNKKEYADLIKSPKSYFKNYKMSDYNTYISKGIPHTLSLRN